MYNRYIPGDADYVPAGLEEVPIPPEDRPGPPQSPPSSPRPAARGPGRGGQGSPFSAVQNLLGQNGVHLPAFLSGKEGLSGLTSLFSGKESRGLSSLLKTLKLGDLDTGDILLLLIVLYLLIEGDDLELVIALGLVLIMGLGEEKKEDT